MKTKLIVTGFTLVIAANLFNGCQKTPALKALKPKLPELPYTYSSSSFVDNSPIDNRLTNDGATLGRVLFYDPRLSLNNSVSCATCHKQQYAFADEGAFSTGYEGQLTGRNTPAVINAAEKRSFFWDGRETSLERMVLMPVRHRVEMGLEQSSVLEKKIASIDFYPQLFANAFGTPEVTADRISMALAQFVRSIASKQSRMDFSQLTLQEQQGQNLFFQKGCVTCHASFNLGGDNMASDPYSGVSTTLNAANIGLDVEYKDKGIMELNSDANSNGAFKIPSLRNLAYTAPYMHDGRFKTLEEVVEHYNTGIMPSQKLDVVLRDNNGQPLRMNMSTEEKAALVAFLRSATDDHIVHDVRYSNPF